MHDHLHIPLARRADRQEFNYHPNLGWLSIGVFLFLIAFARHGVGVEISLAWDAVNDARLGGYELHYGSSPGDYNAQIEVGNTTDYIVTGLNAGTTYFFGVRAYSQDKSLVSNFSNEISATIEAPDTGPPTVSITTSPAGPTYTSAQVVTISAAATNDRSVTRVEFYDGTTLKGTDTTSPYGYAWGITGADNGTHTWTAKAYDDAGNIGTSSNLARTVNIVQPTPATESITLAWNAVSDDLRVSGYEVHFGTGSGQYQWIVRSNGAGTDTQIIENLQPGSTYYFAVKSCNSDGSQVSTFSNEISVTIGTPDIAPPTVSITTSPVGPTYTSAQVVTISATATDDRSVTRVEFYDGTTLKGTDTTSPYSYAWGITGADNGTTHTWTAKAYDDAGNIGTSSNLTRTVNIAPPTPAPVADFAVDTTSGTAPLTVVFSDNSSQDVTAWSWSFGDGGNSTAETAVYTYAAAGTYDVSLTVTGPGGSDTETKPGFVVVASPETPVDPTVPILELEMGEIVVDHEWQRVDFEQPFVDAIVVANVLSANGSDPAVVRVDGIDANGFWIRVQEWDYLDGIHYSAEVVSYLVMENGSHQLADGSWVEAGRLQTSTTNAFDHTLFEDSFAETPVVLTAVTSANGDDAVTSRIRRVDLDGFEFGLREQEANVQSHVVETIDYIAWEPSSGVTGSLRYEVKRTADAVTHRVHTIVYESAFEQLPIFLANMQSTDGGDTANLRWRNKTTGAVDMWVDEEQSRDSETNHTKETVGYILLEFVN